jgi:uncharacterized protein YgiM (DUF1202 family)
MSNQANRAILSAALISVFAVSAPMAASAQVPQRGNDRAPVQQNRPQVQASQTRPSSPAPQQSVRPSAPAPAHQAKKGPERPQAQAQRAGRYRITSTVNLRSGAGQQFRRVGQVRAGNTVQVDQVRNGWLHIRNQGWISAQYARRV